MLLLSVPLLAIDCFVTNGDNEEHGGVEVRKDCCMCIVSVT